MAENIEIRDRIIEGMLPDVPFDGWTMDAAKKAAANAGYEKAMVKAVFPDGLADLLGGFADWADRRMLDALNATDPDTLKVRERIATAVMARFRVLEPYREAERRALVFWSVPWRKLQAGKIVWRTADRIWDWAGDTATDYNHYTKRGLLCGVLGSSMLAFLNDDSENIVETEAFVQRRIENVLSIGKVIGKFKKAS